MGTSKVVALAFVGRVWGHIIIQGSFYSWVGESIVWVLPGWPEECEKSRDPGSDCSGTRATSSHRGGCFHWV